MMPSTRAIIVSLLVGLFHATALLAVALHLGYTVGPSSYSLFGMAGDTVQFAGSIERLKSLLVIVEQRNAPFTKLISVEGSHGLSLGDGHENQQRADAVVRP